MNAVATKSCTRCGNCKPFAEYRVNKRYADGRVTWCNDCQKAYRAEHYQRNRDKVRAQNGAWYAANRDACKAASKAAYAANRDKHGERVKAAKARAPERYREQNKLNARRRRERIDVRLRSRISSQLRYCLSTGKGGRTAASLLGYSIAELRVHLERQFLPGMSWDNFGAWHIDHIVPLSSFTVTGADDPELRRAWALTNLRPLWAADNIAKGAKRETLL